MDICRLFLAALFLVLCGVCFSPAANGGERARKFVEPKDDPFFQALEAIGDQTLKDRIGEAVVAFFGSDFEKANALFAALLAKYPETALGGDMYEHLLLMYGTSLGFSGRAGEGLSRLDELLDRYEVGGDPEKRADALAVSTLKIDILEQSGDSAKTLRALDAVLEKFGDLDLPEEQWRLEMLWLRRADTLRRIGDRDGAIAAYQAFIAKYRDSATAKGNLERAQRELEELQAHEREAGEGLPE